MDDSSENVILRSAVGAAFPLFTQQMFNGLGVNWASSLLGFVALALAPSPLLFYAYGEKIRKWSRFAPAKDNERRRELEEGEVLPKDSENVRLGNSKHGLPHAKRALQQKRKEQQSAA